MKVDVLIRSFFLSSLDCTTVMPCCLVPSKHPHLGIDFGLWCFWCRLSLETDGKPNHSLWKSIKLSRFTLPCFVDTFLIELGALGFKETLWLVALRMRLFKSFSTSAHCLKITQNVAFEFLILAFSTNFCPIKTDLSGNTVWPQASGFQKLAKMDHFWPF